MLNLILCTFGALLIARRLAHRLMREMTSAEIVSVRRFQRVMWVAMYALMLALLCFLLKEQLPMTPLIDKILRGLVIASGFFYGAADMAGDLAAETNRRDRRQHFK